VLLRLLRAAPAHAPPQRIVSLFPCLDTILVSLADREQIAALSYYARDGRSSTIADIAAELPMTYGSAEEVLALKPDLVVTSAVAEFKTRQALRRVNVPMALFDVPLSVADSIAQVRKMAAAVGQEARGEALVAQIEAALIAAAPPEGAAPITALMFQANGFVAGRGVLIDELMTRTGFTNVAPRYQFKQFDIVSLERIVADPPRALLAGRAESSGRSWADRVVSHPALRAVKGRMARAEFPEKFYLCGGPVIPKTLELLTEARRAVEAP
jgi:iron complex transport system substrate-binding protein